MEAVQINVEGVLKMFMAKAVYLLGKDDELDVEAREALLRKEKLEILRCSSVVFIEASTCNTWLKAWFT